MMCEEKSHVGMGYSVCPVCLKEHDEVVLLDKRLEKTLTRHEFMGWELCPEHKKLIDEGRTALIEVTSGEDSSLRTPFRTGRYAFIANEALKDVEPSPIAFMLQKDFEDLYARVAPVAA